ncbi:anthranilate phosphoribosyltransferase [bacterium]|nr:anthranilate phosphoribosyltransferase [bacterium]MBU1752848.1 anthranilate phosphoribosyltransferase [bacterium]
MIKNAIETIVRGNNLSMDEMIEVMNEIMTGAATQAQIGSFITGLRMKGETVEEITGAVTVMRQKATRIHAQGDVVDTCGTGGDGLHTFNISTISALVAAGCGVKVAKHGNRSVSSKCGSADLLMGLGVNIEATPETVERCIEEIGIGFLFAPMLHPAMKHAIGPRREIGIRTIFNILGPMTNPAGAKFQLIGVYDPDMTESMANVLKNLGSVHAFVVHGEEGLDEISISGKTKITELRNKKISTYFISPENFGLKKGIMEEIRGGSIDENVELALDVLSGKEQGTRKNIVLLNAAFVLQAAGVTEDITEAINLSAQSIDSGAAMEKLERLREMSK